MKSFYKIVPLLILALCLLPLFSSCEREDDVMEIFTGKTWRMSYIFPEGSYSNPLDLWNGDAEAYEKSKVLASDKSHFNLTFQGGLTNTGQMGGTFTGVAVNATVVGQWTADGETRALNFSNVKWTGSESDVLAKAFMKGVSSNVYKYSGDNGNLYLHYKDGELLRVVGMIPKK